jgi:enoyl-CoA hydratase
MTDPRILVSTQNNVAVITLARPEKLNALDFAMIRALEDAATRIDMDRTIRVAIITGQGDKSFCAGGDIEAWSKMDAGEFGLSWVRYGHRAFDALTQLRQPLIAALDGHALGGGLELAACADFRIAGDHIRIGLPETGIGIIPGWSGTQRAVKRFGSQIIRRMALGGEIFSAEQARGFGLVDDVVPKGEAMKSALDLASRISARGTFATSLAKLMINAADGEDEAAAIEALGGAAAAGSAELKEKVAAFFARKKG